MNRFVDEDHWLQREQKVQTGKSLARFAPFVLFAANLFHLQIARNQKILTSGCLREAASNRKPLSTIALQKMR
jgi:hypothetical protein